MVLAFRQPVAIVLLVMFTRSNAKRGALLAPGWLTLVASVAAAIIVALNMKLPSEIAGR